jgi:hypothetical protein
MSWAVCTPRTSFSLVLEEERSETLSIFAAASLLFRFRSNCGSLFSFFFNANNFNTIWTELEGVYRSVVVVVVFVASAQKALSLAVGKKRTYIRVEYLKKKVIFLLSLIVTVLVSEKNHLEGGGGYYYTAERHSEI